MNRVIFCFFILSFSNLFSQKNIVNLDSIIKVDNYKVYKDLSYGNHERNVLDLWISNSKINTPLMIYIHGGGFGSGSKESAYRKNNFNRIKKFIENGISFATINYRFKNNDDGILISLNDAKRALQFLRHKSDQFRIDKSKIGVMGSSAGATSSLWLGFFDDMAHNIKVFKKNFRLFIDMSIFLNLHKNKVSNSSYPTIAEKERQLLQRLTFYDLKLYNEIKKFKKEK